jgi:CBS domain-containing protein
METIIPEPNQYFVRDIMTRSIVKVTQDASVSEIALLMSQHRISGVPVVDEQDRVLGVVTELDMVVRNTRFKLPAFFTLLNATIYFETPGHIKERLHHMLGLTAGEIMSEKAVSVSAGANIEDLAELMVGKQVNPIPVVEDGRLVGMVSRSDIVRWMAKSIAE